MKGGGGALGALVFVIGILLAFAVLFGLFLIVPFFVFIAAVIVMLVTERRNRPRTTEAKRGEAEVVEVVETRTEVREVES